MLRLLYFIRKHMFDADRQRMPVQTKIMPGRYQCISCKLNIQLIDLHRHVNKKVLIH